MLIHEVKPVRAFMGRLSRGADLLEGLTDACAARGIRAGRLTALGAVERARLAFYDQSGREYKFFMLDEPLEITALVGNVSLREGAPFVHAHVTLADGRGRAFGGHLAPGTLVFACEFVLEAFEGPSFVRAVDEETGLALWKAE